MARWALESWWHDGPLTHTAYIYFIMCSQWINCLKGRPTTIGNHGFLLLNSFESNGFPLHFPIAQFCSGSKSWHHNQPQSAYLIGRSGVPIFSLISNKTIVPSNKQTWPESAWKSSIERHIASLQTSIRSSDHCSPLNLYMMRVYIYIYTYQKLNMYVYVVYTSIYVYIIILSILSKISKSTTPCDHRDITHGTCGFISDTLSIEHPASASCHKGSHRDRMIGGTKHLMRRSMEYLFRGIQVGSNLYWGPTLGWCTNHIGVYSWVISHVDYI